MITIVLTCGRSGSTLFSLMLNKHLLIDAPPERRFKQFVGQPKSGNIYADLLRDYPKDRVLIIKETRGYIKEFDNLPLKFIWLVRHPIPCIRSIRQNTKQTSRKAAEWRWLHRNLRSYNAIQGRPHIRVLYEDLVRNPKETMTAVCEFLNVAFASEMIKPYANPDEVAKYAVRGLGDWKQRYRTHIDPSLANVHDRIFNQEILNAIEIMGLPYQ